MSVDSFGMNLLAPAKINLHLRVGSRRPDGFHPLVSWMCTVGLFDNLALSPVESVPAGERSGSAQPVSLTCDLPDLAVDQSNLIVRAGEGFLQAARDEMAVPRSASFHATLTKRIPMGAGLGGGSSDGARTLIGLDALFQTRWPLEKLSALAARFGSDMPFFVHGPSSICRGRGEHVRPIPPPRSAWVVLMLPSIMMPTAGVYRRFDDMGLGFDREVESDLNWASWAQLPAEELLSQLVNDLEAPAFAIAPALAELRKNAENRLHRPVRMSGSGSSLFTLFDEQPDAIAAADQLTRELAVRSLAVKLAPELRDDLHVTR